MTNLFDRLSLHSTQVTDWQYYKTEEYSGERTPISPQPMDPTQPSRTRSSSGSVVRLFRGEIGGKLGGKMRSRGLDCRVWVKVCIFAMSSLHSM